MVTDVRASLLAVVTALSCAVVVMAKAASAPAPPARRPATAAERAEIARSIAKAERGWLEESVQAFPEDRWSQRDDFHARELRHIVQTVNDRGVPVEDVLRAIDEDIHRRRANGPDAPDDRQARAIPCKPRPFYD